MKNKLPRIILFLLLLVLVLDLAEPGYGKFLFLNSLAEKIPKEQLGGAVTETTDPEPETYEEYEAGESNEFQDEPVSPLGNYK